MSSVFTMSSGSSGIDDNGEITAVGENAEAVTLQAQAEVLGLSREDAQSALRLAGMREQRRQYFAADHGNGQDVVEVTSPYAFAVGPKKMKARFGFLLGQRSSRPMTPTRLEALATCRYRGFVEGLLRVDNEIEGGQDGDLRVLGELAHLVLERFYRERRNQKVPPTRMNAADRDRLVEILQSCAAPMHQGQTVGHLAALRANITWLQSALVRTVHQLARHPPVPGASPASFELAVGTPGAAVAPVAGDRDSDAASELRFPAVRLKLQGTPFYFGGVIDRVDKGPDSRVVIDYKNSTASAVARKLAPNELMVHHFQLPLYLRLLEAHVPSDPRRKLFAYLVSLREGETSEVLGHVGRLRRRILDDDAKDGLVAGLGRVLLPVLNGNITAEPGRHCQGCRVARVCRRPDVGWLPEGPVLEQGAQRG